jgi:hypothetical protein
MSIPTPGAPGPEPPAGSCAGRGSGCVWNVAGPDENRRFVQAAAPAGVAEQSLPLGAIFRSSARPSRSPDRKAAAQSGKDRRSVKRDDAHRPTLNQPMATFVLHR